MRGQTGELLGGVSVSEEVGVSSIGGGGGGGFLIKEMNKQKVTCFSCSCYLCDGLILFK